MAMNPRLLRPTPTGFDPRRIANLAYWLDATDASTITTVSGAVSEWRSKVNGTTATQGSGANRPAYTLAGRNGRNVVTFDGTSSFMTTGTLSINQPLTVFWAGQVTGTGATYAPFIIDGTLSENRVAIGWNSDGGTKNGRAYAFAGGGSVIEPASGRQAYAAWSVLASVFNGASSLIRANGVQVASGNPGANNVAALTLGSRFNQAAGSFLNGPWGAFLIYSRALTTAETQRVEGYLAWKWGLEAQLPYDHPYAKSFPGFGSQTTPSDSDTLTYLAAVKAADGTGVEVSVANAVDDFVKGCKQDGTWSAIKASCILAGARTLAGALVPLRGVAPTNNGPFVTGDYNRKTGLVGNGSTKYLDTNFAFLSAAQNNRHAAVWVSTAQSSGSHAYFGSSLGSTPAEARTQLVAASGAEGLLISRCADATSNTSATSNNVAGAQGLSRSASASYTRRANQIDQTVTVSSLSGDENNMFVFVRNNTVSSLHATARIAYYSFGDSLTLSTLDSRLSTLITAIGAAI